jgi:hypothetical protein
MWLGQVRNHFCRSCRKEQHVRSSFAGQIVGTTNAPITVELRPGALIPWQLGGIILGRTSEFDV